jgi:hypothetical protein
LLPFYISIGVSEEKFMDSNPNELKPYVLAYKMTLKRNDEADYRLGQYIQSAIGSCLNKENKYVEKPFLSDILQEENPDDYDIERNERIAVMEMQQYILELNKQGGIN